MNLGPLFFRLNLKTLKSDYLSPGCIQSLQKAAIKVIILNAEQLLLAICLLRLHSEIITRHTPDQRSVMRSEHHHQYCQMYHRLDYPSVYPR